MKTDRDNIKGLAGTIIFHGLLLIGLLLMALKTPLPLPTESGVEVNLGNSDDGMGDVRPEQLAAGSPETSAPSQATAREEVVTEDNDEAPMIDPVKKDKPVVTEKAAPKKIAKPTPKPEPKPVVNPNAMYKGKTGKTTGGGNQGITGNPGDQGKANGTPGSDNYDGPGGAGGGVSFDLSGRTSRQIPRPSDKFTEGGTVVVTIFVNRAGQVTRVIAGAKGTTTSNLELRQLAEQAARRARFSPKEDAPEEQKGTITYIFELY
ncbi:MAG: energy transducer TonB [Bacteroidota bacterium]